MYKYLFITALFFKFSVVTFAQVNDNKIATSQKFDEVLTYVNRMYVDDVDPADLTDAAIIALLEKLDPHSTFISKEEVDEANSSINGSFVGIGIRFQIIKDTLMVVATIPGGPSEKIGIKPGDKILKVDGINMAGVGIKNSDVRERLMGELGSKVNIELKRRKYAESLDYIITRDNIPIHSIDASYMITPNIGYIKLNSFSRSTSAELQEAIRKLKVKGMEHLIFDLQGNGGGLLDQAQKVVDEFLSGNKLIVYSIGKAQPKNELKAFRDGLWEEGNLVVLTDENSASASEIVSGAIQDWDRGLIIGRRTYGKGLVQRPIDLSDGSQMRLTIARYYTPGGRFIQKPYEDIEEYRNDLNNRYKHGEFTNVDSIKLSDSLKFQTLELKRTVYGGGGIMPDIFVPLDTSEITDYYRNVMKSGHVNTFAFQYADENRDALNNTYSSFDLFLKNFKITDEFMKEFINHIKKEDADLVFNQKEYNTSKKLLELQLKASIAQDIWGNNEFYHVFNDSNEIIQRAVKAIENGEFKQLQKK